MFKHNSTFTHADPTWANACVGENGSPQAFEYAAGFAAAANLLLDAVIVTEGVKYHVDEFVYPICFNMRHAVELFLKAVVKQIQELGDYRHSLPAFDGAASHDLSKIWTFVSSHAPSLDRRYVKPIEELDDFINDIAEVDSTGQVFRYPYSSENNKHLTEIATINVLVLRQRFKQLQKKLKSLHYLGKALLEEYSWGCYTTKLSREELLSIALILPPRQEWTKESFLESRDSIRQEWELSSKDFQRAMCKIQANYETATMIGMQIPLQYVNEKLLLDFIGFWAMLHDLEKVRNPPEPSVADFSKNDLIDGIKRRHEIQNECWRKMAEFINPEVLGELESLFYFHREMYYSEAFVKMRERARNELAADQRPDRAGWKRRLLHLLDKTNGLENILNSLNFLGQRDLMVVLIDRLDLQQVIHRLLQQSTARSWVVQRMREQPT